MGQQWFWLRVGGFPSNASFTNTGSEPLPLTDGTMARVTWFADPWYGNETRIVKLELGPPPGKVGATDGSRSSGLMTDAPADFREFWRRFVEAAGAGDKDAVAGLAHFPFDFAGTPLTRDRWDSIWMALFPEPLRGCYAAAVPARDGDGWTASCGAYVYSFGKGEDGWRLTGFAAGS